MLNQAADESPAGDCSIQHGMPRLRIKSWIYLIPIIILNLSVGTGCRAAEVNMQHQWMEATSQKLPRWRGFNLLEKFTAGKERRPFLESDFQLISELGFNFVRLPMDYRGWIKNENWEEFDEASLQQIDQAVEWGRQYGIHVCINFHRAPGYTVAKPPEARSIWTDPEARRVCAEHWALFARRYKGIPNTRLSFNLMNEPPDIEASVYAEVVKGLVDAIHREDPSRLIIADGLSWGTRPVFELKSLGVAEATRGYTPMEVSHYKASWISGADTMPRPTWPRLDASGMLYGPSKKELSTPFELNGPFEKATDLRLHVAVVSTHANLIVETDGKRAWEKSFTCGPGEGEWKTVDYKEQWKIYQNLYDRDYTVSIPAGTRKVRLSVTEGDWMQISEIGLKPTGSSAAEDQLQLSLNYGSKPVPVGYAPGAPNGPFVTSTKNGDREWLWQTMIEPWKKLEESGVGVMVGEWGAHNQTPHDVVLHWMEDCLTNWQKAGWGWAMWNFRGSFGVLDSGRSDVQYEDFHGHKLDRKMLELLQRY